MVKILYSGVLDKLQHVPKDQICAHILIKMLQVHNMLLKMCNLSNIIKTANIIPYFKTFPRRHLATVDKRFVTLQRIRIVRVTSTLS